MSADKRRAVRPPLHRVTAALVALLTFSSVLILASPPEAAAQETESLTCLPTSTTVVVCNDADGSTYEIDINGGECFGDYSVCVIPDADGCSADTGNLPIETVCIPPERVPFLQQIREFVDLVSSAAGGCLEGLQESVSELWDLVTGLLFNTSAYIEEQVAGISELYKMATADPSGFVKTMALAMVGLETMPESPNEWAEWAGKEACKLVLEMLTGKVAAKALSALRKMARGDKLGIEDQPWPPDRDGNNGDTDGTGNNGDNNGDTDGTGNNGDNNGTGNNGTGNSGDGKPTCLNESQQKAVRDALDDPNFPELEGINPAEVGEAFQDWLARNPMFRSPLQDTTDAFEKWLQEYKNVRKNNRVGSKVEGEQLVDAGLVKRDVDGNPILGTDGKPIPDRNGKTFGQPPVKPDGLVEGPNGALRFTEIKNYNKTTLQPSSNAGRMVEYLVEQAKAGKNVEFELRMAKDGAISPSMWKKLEDARDAGVRIDVVDFKGKKLSKGQTVDALGLLSRGAANGGQCLAGQAAGAVGDAIALAAQAADYLTNTFNGVPCALPGAEFGNDIIWIFEPDEGLGGDNERHFPSDLWDAEGASAEKLKLLLRAAAQLQADTDARHAADVAQWYDDQDAYEVAQLSQGHTEDEIANGFENDNPFPVKPANELQALLDECLKEFSEQAGDLFSQGWQGGDWDNPRCAGLSAAILAAASGSGGRSNPCQRSGDCASAGGPLLPGPADDVGDWWHLVGQPSSPHLKHFHFDFLQNLMEQYRQALRAYEAAVVAWNAGPDVEGDAPAFRFDRADIDACIEAFMDANPHMFPDDGRCRELGLAIVFDAMFVDHGSDVAHTPMHHSFLDECFDEVPNHYADPALSGTNRPIVGRGLGLVPNVQWKIDPVSGVAVQCYNGLPVNAISRGGLLPTGDLGLPGVPDWYSPTYEFFDDPFEDDPSEPPDGPSDTNDSTGSEGPTGQDGSTLTLTLSEEDFWVLYNFLLLNGNWEDFGFDPILIEEIVITGIPPRPLDVPGPNDPVSGPASTLRPAMWPAKVFVGTIVRSEFEACGSEVPCGVNDPELGEYGEDGWLGPENGAEECEPPPDCPSEESPAVECPPEDCTVRESSPDECPPDDCENPEPELKCDETGNCVDQPTETCDPEPKCPIESPKPLECQDGPGNCESETPDPVECVDEPVDCDVEPNHPDCPCPDGHSRSADGVCEPWIAFTAETPSSTDLFLDEGWHAPMSIELPASWTPSTGFVTRPADCFVGSRCSIEANASALTAGTDVDLDVEEGAAMFFDDGSFNWESVGHEAAESSTGFVSSPPALGAQFSAVLPESNWEPFASGSSAAGGEVFEESQWWPFEPSGAGGETEHRQGVSPRSSERRPGAVHERLEPPVFAMWPPESAQTVGLATWLEVQSGFQDQSWTESETISVEVPVEFEPPACVDDDPSCCNSAETVCCDDWDPVDEEWSECCPIHEEWDIDEGEDRDRDGRPDGECVAREDTEWETRTVTTAFQATPTQSIFSFDADGPGTADVICDNAGQPFLAGQVDPPLCGKDWDHSSAVLGVVEMTVQVVYDVTWDRSNGESGSASMLSRSSAPVLLEINEVLTYGARGD